MRKRACAPFHCADLTRSGADLEAFSAREWNAGRKDARIRAAAAIDPAMTYGLGKAHAQDLVDYAVSFNMALPSWYHRRAGALRVAFFARFATGINATEKGPC